MRTLFLDCFSGISGDMSVAALCDLGLTENHLRLELSKLGLNAEFHFHIRRESRQNIEGTRFTVHPTPTTAEEQPHTHSHSHDHPHDHPHDHSHPHTHPHDHDHPHDHGRSFREIRTIIEASDLSQFVKERSIAVFARIAKAEGKIHGMPPDDVTFHEVGAIDSIIDIVAFCVGIEFLGIEKIAASRLVEGTGFIKCAHGQFPLPAPATLEILTGIPLAQCDDQTEFITPTGAALLAEFANSFGPMPAIATEQIGYGVGTRDTPSRPNVLRAILGTTNTSDQNSGDQHIIQIETHWDDFSPELAAPIIDRLLDAGALDVFLQPVQMKKSRPGLLLTALCAPAQTDSLCKILLHETPTFGVRFSEKQRKTLAREFRQVDTPFGKIDVKLALADDGTIVHAKPEFESVKAAAHAANAPLQSVHQSTTAAIHNEIFAKAP